MVYIGIGAMLQRHKHTKLQNIGIGISIRQSMGTSAGKKWREQRRTNEDSEVQSDSRHRKD